MRSQLVHIICYKMYNCITDMNYIVNNNDFPDLITCLLRIGDPRSHPFFFTQKLI